MTALEIENTIDGTIYIKKTKGYFISSFIIMLFFIGISHIGYILNILDEKLLIFILILFFLLTTIIFIFSDRLERVQVEKWGKKFRKFSHLIGGIVMIIFCIYSQIILSWISFSFFLLFLLHEIFYVIFKVPSVYTKTLIFIGRLERNRNSNPAAPKLFYPTLLVLGSIAIIGLFGKMIAIATVITFAFGDSLSALVGERIGTHKLPYNKTKSVEGSLVFFTASFVGVFLAYIVAGMVAWPAALISGVVGAGIESVIPTSFWLDDNAPVPVGVGLALYVASII
ncbi:MAG: diacylglycerol/polyprenol kinase family protein [Candidatus Helarchaeota archaeon]